MRDHFLVFSCTGLLQASIRRLKIGEGLLHKRFLHREDLTYVSISRSPPYGHRSRYQR